MGGIGVVIPVSTGERYLRHTIDAMQDDRVEFVVVARTDEYDDILKDYNVNILKIECSLGEAKNYGAFFFYDKDILIFADAHVKPDRGYIDALSKILRDKSIGIATLATYSMKDFSSYSYSGSAGFRFRYDLRREWYGGVRIDDDVVEVDIVNGAFQAFRKSTFVKIGGFIPFHDEDIEISLRSRAFGYKNVCVTSKRVGHIFKYDDLPFDPVPDYHLGDLLIAYLHYPPEEYDKFKRKYDENTILYIERNFEKLKHFIYNSYDGHNNDGEEDGGDRNMIECLVPRLKSKKILIRRESLTPRIKCLRDAIRKRRGK